MRKARSGFTLPEVVACVIILAFVTLGATSTTKQVTTLKTESRNTVYLSLHNLNVMERLRQLAYGANGVNQETLLAYYGVDSFSSSDIITEVFVNPSQFDKYHVYDVRIESRMRDRKQTLTSRYTLTDIGGYYVPPTMEDEEEADFNLE